MNKINKMGGQNENNKKGLENKQMMIRLQEHGEIVANQGRSHRD